MFLRLLTLWTLLLQGTVLYAEKYVVEPSDLNIRRYPNGNADVIGQLYEGDTVDVITNEGNWLKISINGEDGYIHKNYVRKIGETSGSSEHTDTGFKDGFLKTFKTSFIILFFVFSGIDYFKNKRIKDARFSKGFRELPFSIFELIVNRQRKLDKT